MSDGEKIGLIVDDMFFAAKVRGAAEAAGKQIQRLKTAEQLESELPQNPPSILLIDLHAERVDPLAAIRFVKSRPELAAVPVVAFASHVQTDLIRAAREAGCDLVLPRSAFSAHLNDLVRGDLSAFR